MFLTLLFVAGISASFLSALMGIGGGAILMPSLVLVFSHTAIHSDLSVVHLAINTSLAITLINALFISRKHVANKAINWSLAYMILPGVLMGTLMGALVSTALKPEHTAIIGGCLLISLAMLMAYNTKFKTTHAHEPNRRQLMLSGIAVGAPASFLGIGGGSIMVPLLNHLGVDIKKTVGVTSILTLVTSLTALLTAGFITTYHTKHVSSMFNIVEWHVVFFILPIMLVGVFLGNKCLHHLPHALMSKVFIVILVLMGGLLISQS